jgi:hypothetical protein
MVPRRRRDGEHDVVFGRFPRIVALWLSENGRRPLDDGRSRGKRPRGGGGPRRRGRTGPSGGSGRSGWRGGRSGCAGRSWRGCAGRGWRTWPYRSRGGGTCLTEASSASGHRSCRTTRRGDHRTSRCGSSRTGLRGRGGSGGCGRGRSGGGEGRAGRCRTLRGGAGLRGRGRRHAGAGGRAGTGGSSRARGGCGRRGRCGRGNGRRGRGAGAGLPRPGGRNGDRGRGLRAHRRGRRRYRRRGVCLFVLVMSFFRVLDVLARCQTFQSTRQIIMVVICHRLPRTTGPSCADCHGRHMKSTRHQRIDDCRRRATGIIVHPVAGLKDRSLRASPAMLPQTNNHETLPHRRAAIPPEAWAFGARLQGSKVR